MAEYPKITLTNKAMEMIAAAQIDGTILTITRVKIGDGSLAEGADIKSMTDVINSMLVAPFSNSNNDGGGQITVHFAVSNATVEAGFFAREIGVFAKLNDGEEQLYAYTNAGNKCDWIPDKHTPIDSQVIGLTLIVGNAENVTVHISDEAFALAKDLIDHNTNPKSHPHQLRPPLKRSTAYSVGDICFHDSLPSYAYLECITAGTTAENEPVFTDVNTTITDGTAVFRVITNVRKVNGSYADKDGNINVKEYEHPDSGVEAGTYTSVTVNAQGHVTAGSNPATNNTLVEAKYNEDGSWYRKYSDGWLEQGGKTEIVKTQNPQLITLLKPMKNKLYTALGTYETTVREPGTTTTHGISVSDVQTTYFYLGQVNTPGIANRRLSWYACGQS